MRQYTRSISPTLTLFSAVAMLAVAGCNNNKNDELTTDSALGRDLALAQKDSAQPKLQDVPTTPPPAAVAPSTPAPRTTTPSRPRTTTPTPPRTTTPPATTTNPPASTGTSTTPAATTGVIAAGTSLRFAANSKVCTNTNAVGDKFTATLGSEVTGTNGVRIPEGATGTFEITDAKRAKNANDNTSMSVKLISVTFGGRTYPVDATVQTASTTRVRSATTGDDAKKVVGGAVVGAIIGQVISKNTKGTVVGAAAGGAAGAAAAAATGDYDTCLNNGAGLTVTLDQATTIRMIS